MSLQFPGARAVRSAGVVIFIVAGGQLPPAAAQAVVSVTASREPLAADRIAGDLVVIDADRIAASSADSIEDLLRREAGVQLTRNGGPGQNAGVLIRGSAAVDTVVLVDGVRIGSATLGLAQLEGLSLAGIERIEVLRGPGSSLYGADAVGGVVQIFTRRGEGPPRASVRLAAGGYGAAEAAAQLGAAGPRWDYAATLSHERLRGVSALRPGDAFGNYNPDDDGFRRSSAQASVGLQAADGQHLALRLQAVQLNARYDGSEFLPPDFAQDSSADFRNRLRTRLAALEYRARWNERWTTLLQVSDTVEELASGGRRTDHFRTTRRQAQAQAAWTPRAGQRLVFALERMQEQARSDDYPADRSTEAALVAWSGSFGAWSAQLDARHDRISVTGGVDTGRAGVAWQFAPAWRLRASAGTTFRAPSLNDLYFPGYGVPTIRPERGRSIEFGIDGRRGGSDVSATVWRNAVRDLVGYEPDAGRCPPGDAYAFGCAANTGRARLQGLTLAVGQRWDAVSLRGTLELLDAKDLASGERLPRRAAHQATLDAEWRQGALTWGAALLRLGARPDGGRSLAAETTIDLLATWRVSRAWTLQAKLVNATDRDLEPARDYQGLGRQAWLVLRWEGTP